MEEINLWTRFEKSGKITDYLYFLNSFRAGEKVDGTGEPFHNGGSCDKRNEDRGE